MSSWNKASKTNQRVHRERSQLESRKELGLPEKKRDYILRAQNAHRKEETLKILHKRALNKNPNEFYHHMIRSKIDDDQHYERNQSTDHTKEQLALLQTQNLKYVSTKRTVETKKIQRLQTKLQIIDTANKLKNKHILFINNRKEVKNFDLAKQLGTHPSLVTQKTNRFKIADLTKFNINDIDKRTLIEMENARRNNYKEIKNRMKREKELAVTQQKMEIKRALQQKRLLKPKLIKSETKNSAPIYEFKFERKK